jgi:hypothetical protein
MRDEGGGERMERSSRGMSLMPLSALGSDDDERMTMAEV